MINLDMLVAKKVMRWTLADGSYYKEIYEGSYCLGSEYICNETEFKPMSNIAHAWRVVKMMEKHNFRFDMSTHPTRKMVSVGFELLESKYDLFYKELEESRAEIAICKCALESMDELNRQYTG